MNYSLCAILSTLTKLLCLFAIISCFSCQDSGHAKAKPYTGFFYGSDSSEALVYIYRDLVLDDQYEFWYRSYTDDGRLAAHQFFSPQEITQSVYYRYTEEGICMDSLSLLYRRDSSMNYVSAAILRDDVFYFSALDSSYVLINHFILYETPDSSVFSEVTKNRRMLSSFSSDSVLVYSSQELLEHYDEGYIESRSEALEVYQKDVGLTQFTKWRNNEKTKELKLQEVLRASEFRASYGPLPPGVE